MKISYNWLKEFVDLNESPEKLAEDLSLFGHEVENIEKVGSDFILDFEITPNRGDLLSIYGMAREIAGLYNINLKNKEFNNKIADLDKKLDINISCSNLVPRYTVRLIDNIKVEKSPKWLCDKLVSYGFRPINNIVDITNYVMIETGQPLHAFDYDKIYGNPKKMHVRLSKDGEELITLDGKNYTLKSGSIIIEDDKKIYDLAGIMGGYNSEVDNKTKTIILEAAIFDPITIRKTSKYLNLTSDASYRYERGVDFDGNILGIELASQLIQKLLPKAKIGSIVDKINNKPKTSQINIDPKKISSLLGKNFSTSQINSLLPRLNFDIFNNKVSVPSYRFSDVKSWQDIAEEVARLYGYNNLGLNNLSLEKTDKFNNKFRNIEILKDLLVKNGFDEIYSYSFINRNDANILKIDKNKLIEIIKPISRDAEFLRPSLLPSILNQISKNPWAPEINIFEIGNVFNNKSEKTHLIVALSGKNQSKIDEIFNIIKNNFKLSSINYKVNSIDQSILDKYKIRRKIIYSEIDIESLKSITISGIEPNIKISKNKFSKISNYAPTIRDMAFVVDNKLDAKKIQLEISKIASNILFVELFDEFENEKLGKNKKNIAFHIWLQGFDKPLDEKIVNKIISDISIHITKKYNCTIRNY